MATRAKTLDKNIQTGPDHIRVMCVFATNQCNMACTHCCAPTVKNAKGAVHLTWEDFASAIDVFMDPGQVPYGGRKTISIQGGETFLVYPLLVRAAEYVRTFPTPPALSIHTNGTLAKPGQIERLQDLEAEILISLDGDREGNDRYRRFPGSSERSVWETVLGKLEAVKDKRGIGINMTVRPDTTGSILRALEIFRSMGIGLINIEPDCYHFWTPADLKALETFFLRLSDYYVGRTETDGRCPFHIGTLHDGLERAAYLKRGKRWWLDCTQLILGSDGNFYNCEASNFYDYDADAAFDREAAAGTHSIRHAGAGCGVDWAKREAYMREADAVLGELGPDMKWQIICPRLYYSMDKNNRLSGAKGKGLMEMAQNTHELSRVFQDGLLGLAARLRHNEAFTSLYIDNRSVQGF